MIEQSTVLTAGAVLLVLGVAASYAWPHLRCGHPFGTHPTTGRILRCSRRPFHRGTHVRPWSAPGPIGYLHALPERCGAGHTHSDLGDAIACMYGAPQHRPCGRVVGASSDGKRMVTCGNPSPCAEHQLADR